MNTTTTICNVH